MELDFAVVVLDRDFGLDVEHMPVPVREVGAVFGRARPIVPALDPEPDHDDRGVHDGAPKTSRPSAPSHSALTARMVLIDM